MDRKKRYYRRQWLASPARVISLLFPRWKALDEIAAKLSFVRSVYGPYLLNTPGDKTFELCVEGYGSFISKAIESQDSSFVFLDIGANLGLFSLLAARNPRCKKAIAVEPLPKIFRNLEANIRRNAADKIEPILGAVAATSDPFVYLSFNPRHSGLSTIVDMRSRCVRAPTISAEILDRLIPVSSDAIVAKIDVEGSELDVLTTLRRASFYRSITEIIIEVSEANLGKAKRDLLLGLLAQDGYEELSRTRSPQHYDARYRRVGAGNRTVALSVP
jgi:FkbM family methyltransferase